MTSYRELVARARSLIEELTPAQLQEKLGVVLVLDVREPDEFSQGAIPGAILLSRGVLERDITRLVPDINTEIVAYCQSGHRSALAAVSLEQMGYRASSLAGGFDKWKAEGFAWGDPAGLTVEQRTRYARHVRLPEVGEAGQLALLGARVLIVGAGGLGSPAALYLAAAGVGTIGVVDDDAVDSSNLQRQILHNVERVGMAKVDSARETLLALNPDVKVETHHERLTAANALSILSKYDLIVDGGDNFPTRYLVNDASLHLRVPVIHGSIFRFEGQASVFKPYGGPCYRCLHPEPPPPELAPSCAEAGVFGVLPGVIGTLQAVEALKLILGVGDSLVGRLMIYDALEQDFTTVPVSRRDDCLACGDPDNPPQLIDYDETCLPSV